MGRVTVYLAIAERYCDCIFLVLARKVARVDDRLSRKRLASLVVSHKTARDVRAVKVLVLMLYYSGFLLAVAFIMGTLGFVGPGGTPALVMKICCAVSIVLFAISLARRKKVRS